MKKSYKFLTILAVIFMPYIGFFLILAKRPFTTKANFFSSIYCLAITGILFFMVFSPPKSESGDPILPTKNYYQDIEQETEQTRDIPIKKGEVLESESCKIYVNNVKLSYDVLPKNTSSFYTHYASESGQVYIDISVDVKNIQKQNLNCDRIMDVTADYNNGYTYSAFAVVEDNNTGFTYASISDISPLETQGMRYLIDCPQEVAETSYPLFLTFELGDKTYKYVIR